ncbi:uncharacterized protein F54H12.2-like [Convolutriloba macropyga]|uniref:uncharacterized protein F54H12.2-like n=1 Tax=Convolutriloba macropyga TaxID=536237 RepID=UPI003F521D36
MDCHYDAQTLQHTPYAGGPARQFGSDAAGRGALAVRVGRTALPLLKKYALPLVKKIGRNLVQAPILNYESTFDQQVFPQVGASGPTLDFVVSGDNRNCIDLNYIHLSLVADVYDEEGRTKIKASDGVGVIFVNNAMHSLFSQVELYLNGSLISDSNNTYHHRALIETELTTNQVSKSTWAACQGYAYNPDPDDKRKTTEWYANRLKQTLAAEYRMNFYGTLYVDFFTCERLLLPEVNKRIKLCRSSSEFSLMGLRDDAKIKFTAVVGKASIFVRESVKLSIERALLKAPARYPNIESLCKSSILQSGQNSFVKESIFGTEPNPRLTVCMIANAKFRGSLATDPFHYIKFGLTRIEIGVTGYRLPAHL